MDADTDTKRNLIGSVDKAINILKFLARQRDGASLMQVSKEFSWPHSTVHHILATLKHHGFVQQIPPGKRYHLGMTLFELGQRVLEHFNLVELSMPHLRVLTDRTKETSNLATLDGLHVVHLAQVPSEYLMKALTRVGGRVPAHCTALGKCLLSGMTDDEIRALYEGVELVKLTSRTVDNLEDLLRQVANTRARGYAVDNQEREHAVHCVAAPIMINGGRVIAGVSVSGPSTRLNTNDESIIGAVIACAEDISAQLRNL